MLTQEQLQQMFGGGSSSTGTAPTPPPPQTPAASTSIPDNSQTQQPGGQAPAMSAQDQAAWDAYDAKMRAAAGLPSQKQVAQQLAANDPNAQSGGFWGNIWNGTVGELKKIKEGITSADNVLSNITGGKEVGDMALGLVTGFAKSAAKPVGEAVAAGYNLAGQQAPTWTENNRLSGPSLRAAGTNPFMMTLGDTGKITPEANAQRIALEKSGATGASPIDALNAATPEMFTGLGETAISKAGELIDTGKEALATKSAVNDTATALERVSESGNMTKNKAIAALKTPGRAISPTLTGEAAIASTPEEIRLANEYTDLLSHSKPADSLSAIHEELGKTGNELDSLLKSETKDIRTTKMGPGMMPQQVNPATTALDAIKENIPIGLKSEGATTKAYTDVADYAKTLVENNPQTAEGLRNARTQFDQAASKQFPNAYKNGFIDTKSPAGAAIKAVRDALNDTLYSTAENGSKIQELIGRERDMYKMLDTVAPKAAKQLGKSGFRIFLDEHPNLVKAGYVAAGALGLGGVEKTIKKFTGQ